MCPYSELFWSVFSQNNSEYRHILRSGMYIKRFWFTKEENILTTFFVVIISNIEVGESRESLSNVLNNLISPSSNSFSFKISILKKWNQYTYSEYAIVTC